MFKRFSVSLLTAMVSVVVLVGIANAQDIVTLETVQVTATTSDNVIVSIPVDYLAAARFQRAYASIGETDYVTELSRAQVCQVLKQHPPQNCTIHNYPASPGIPSAAGAVWAGNGCGAGSTSSALASAILARLHATTYSGDLNRPVKYNPSIDFTAICNDHDRGYTSVAAKKITDDFFARRLTALCNAAPSDGVKCGLFAGDYAWAVRTMGDSAYEEDQKQLACSAWGDSMKKSGCV